ncbi:hypothetical protein F5B19DRAFT_374294 [Rostrohypoxylon terebratum]|nr:hypothetical protein F5B19DRAFT_374294 [Rostrohypoxylon terebratum]
MTKYSDFTEDKALYASVDNEKPKPYDFSIDFDDSQKIQRLRLKLLKASAILESSLEVARGYEIHCQDISKRDMGGGNISLFIEVELYTAKLRAHRRSTNVLLERTKEVFNLILKYRNATGVAANTEASHHALMAMQKIANEAEMGRRVDQKNGTTIKALTFIATMYLPASLLAGVFNSNLIVAKSTGPNTDQTYYAVATEFWKFIVISIGLILITFLVAILLEKVWSRQSQLIPAKGGEV